jgi:hypothetical protein
MGGRKGVAVMKPAIISECARNLSIILAIGLIALLTMGCEEDVTGVKEIPQCERYGTADVTFLNGSDYSTYDVILDGSRIGTISPGRSITRTVAAGVHSVQFIFSNTGQPACYEAHPNLAACEKTTLSCSNDY